MRQKQPTLPDKAVQALAAKIEAVLTGCKGKHFSTSAIRKYAQNAATDVHHVIPLAHHARESYKQWQILGEAIEDTCPAFEALYGAIACNYETQMLHKTAVNSVFIDHDCDARFRVNLDAVREYLVMLQNLHAEYKKSPKSGKNNLTSLVLAETLAVCYYSIFKTMPSCGRGRIIDSRKRGAIIKKSPFDKVCEIIEQAYKIEIPDSTRKAAIKAITCGGIIDS